MPVLKVGQHAEISKTISDADVVLYAGIVGDFCPLYMDEVYARQTRVGARMAPPILACGLISSVLCNALPGPEFVSLRQQYEFLAPILIGDTVTATVEVISVEPEKRMVSLKTSCHNQQRKQILAGEAVLILLEKGNI